MTHDTCDLLVMSTDRYLPEAQLTIGQLKRLGLAEAFDSYVSLGDLTPVIHGFQVLHRERPGTWSAELRSCLCQLRKPYVLLWLDDFVPVGIEGVPPIVSMIDEFIRREGNYLRLTPTPKGNGTNTFGRVSEILPGEHYRTSTVFCVWRREILLELLDDTETAWQFEYDGSARSDRYSGFYASDTETVRYVNLVVKGLVDPRAERRLRQEGVDTSTLPRARMSRGQLLRVHFAEARSRGLSMLPWWARRTVRKVFQTNVKTRG